MEDFTMTTINLKDLYYWYTQDQLIEVSDEVAEVFKADARYEMAYQRRLIASLGFLLVLMYFSMGHMMWGWPLPRWFDGNHIAMVSRYLTIQLIQRMPISNHRSFQLRQMPVGILWGIRPNFFGLSPC